MKNKLKILHLEDSIKDSDLIRSLIESEKIGCDYFLVENENDFINILETEMIDIILSDYNLPDYNGDEALKIVREKYYHIPFIFVSGVMGEDKAIDAILNGATDYVLKNRLERLVPAIKRASREHEQEVKRNQIEKKLIEKTELIENQNEKYIQINKELVFQNQEKEKRAAELIIANKELIFQNQEKEKRAAELIIANKELIFQKQEKEKRSAELIIANKELIFQNQEKEKRAAELIIANKELIFQNQEKEKRAAELIIANKELVFQNQEKEKRAAELIIANKELVFQKNEKEKRAAELIIADIQKAAVEKFILVIEEKNKYITDLNEKLEVRVEERTKELQKSNESLQQEIIERVKIEADLAASYEQYHNALNLMMEGCQIIDFNWRYSYINDAAAKHQRLKKENVLGYKMTEIFPEIDKTPIFYVLQKCMKNRIPAKIDNQFTYTDGNSAWFSMSLHPIPGGIFILSIDITEQKIAQDEILKMNAELEKRVVERTKQLEVANKELESFSYSVSHDLRSPLRSIDGFGNLLQKNYSSILDAQATDYITRIRKATQKMGQLIDDLLKLSRINRLEMKRENVNLSIIAESIVKDLRSLFPDRKVETIIENDLCIAGDSNHFHILLTNLFENAWKYSAKKEFAKIEFGKIIKENLPVYFIRDNGVGFNMKYVNKLFGAFQRLHGINEFEGNGIGLATAQRIINRHGGEIWAEAELDKGATFYFKL
jgi:signal transduction histidine kinase/DNA-binding response OmpR family regulator